MALERLRDRRDRRRQDTLEVRVGLGKADPAATRRGDRPDGEALALGERHGLVPGPARVDVGAGDHHRALRVREALGKVGHRGGVGGGTPGDRALDRVGDRALVDLGVPVVHRDRDEDGPLRRQVGEMGRAADRRRDVLGARHLVAPLDERVRHPRRVAVGQVGLHRHRCAHLLARRDDQRRVVGLGVEDRAHRVADARCRVQVDQRRRPARLREAVGHPDHDRLLEPEDVAEVAGEVAQHRQLGRARVAEHRRHPRPPEELERGLADVGHAASLREAITRHLSEANDCALTLAADEDPYEES